MEGDNLGEQLRLLRVEKGLTLRALAEQVKKSESYLSRLENSQINPTLGTLKRIADALGRPLVHLLENDFPPLGAVKKMGEHRRLIVSPGLEYEILSVPNHQVTLFKGVTSGEAYRHQGVETGIVLQGTIKITVGYKEFLLRKGDSITYRSEEFHHFENAGKGDVLWIWAVSPPTF